jgi:hypothetical protein
MTVGQLKAAMTDEEFIYWLAYLERLHEDD